MSKPVPLCDDYSLLTTIIRPGLQELPLAMSGSEAEAMLIAIAIQESDVTHLIQVGTDGKPLYHLARGLWQFEFTGVDLVMKHDSCTWLRDNLYAIFEHDPTPYEVHDILPAHFVVATLLARANLWWHSQPLPTVHLECEEAAWQYYLTCWNPGKPHRERWTGAWARAVDTVGTPPPDLFA